MGARDEMIRARKPYVHQRCASAITTFKRPLSLAVRVPHRVWSGRAQAHPNSVIARNG